MNRTLVCVLFLLLWSSVSLAAERIAIIVDTSGSMNTNDRPRYAAQISKILGDLVDDDDYLSLIRMPSQQQAALGRSGGGFFDVLDQVMKQGARGNIGSENCSASPLPDLSVELRGSDRSSFKSKLDRLLVNDTGTFFAIPIATAEAFLGRSGRRMLLILADSGGFGPCDSQLNSRLASLRGSGVYVGLINLGSSAGDFRGSQAFDVALAAPNSQALIEAVARVYQQFLGSRKVQTGAVRGPIRVTVDAYVSEAFLVVAAEGPVSPLQPASGNPGAAAIDSDYRGGGSTQGLDRRTRGYRIVKLTNPEAGEWVFDGATASGGWMLIQESAISVRAIAGQQALVNAASRIELEVIDERTGRRISNPAALANLKVSANAGGQPIALRNNGDGTLSLEPRFSNAGAHTIIARVSSDSLDREIPVTVNAVAGGWKLTSTTSSNAVVGQPFPLTVKLEPVGRGGEEPNRIVARTSSGETVELRKGPDGTFGGYWNPSKEGAHTIQFQPIGGQGAAPIEIAVNVTRRLEPPPIAPPPSSGAPPPVIAPPPSVGTPPAGGPPLAGGPPPAGGSPPTDLSPVVTPPTPSTGNPVTSVDKNPAGGSPAPPARTPGPDTPPPAPPPKSVTLRGNSGQQLNFGRLKSGSEASGTLELEGIPADGQTELVVSTDLPSRGIHLEIAGPNGWIPVDSSPAVLNMSDSKWSLRLRVGSCPAACKAGDEYNLNVSLRNAGGMSDVLDVPVRLDVEPDPWLGCNWPYLAGIGLALLGSLIVYGFYSPFRFARRAGVQLSPEIDLTEGFFYALRAMPGAKAGFYRNARLFIGDDFRISGKNSGAFAKIRAGSNNKIYITPCSGRETWRQRIDGEWERLPDTETVAPVGAMFRNDQGSVYFDVRLR